MGAETDASKCSRGSAGQEAHHASTSDERQTEAPVGDLSLSHF
jgi:hypothetical protein